MSKLTPEGEVIASYGAATVAAFQVLINCLEESDALLPGPFAEALRIYIEMTDLRIGNSRSANRRGGFCPDGLPNSRPCLSSFRDHRSYGHAEVGLVRFRLDATALH